MKNTLQTPNSRASGSVQGFWTIAPEENCPPPSSQIIIHWKIAHPRVDDYSQKISPEENYPLDNGLCGKLPPGWLHPDYWSQTNIPKIIAPWQYPLGNCPRAKLSFRWFVFYRIASRTNGPKENCPLGKHSQG